jgi:hypothetical protein
MAATVLTAVTSMMWLLLAQLPLQQAVVYRCLPQ